MTNAVKFQEQFGLYATELWAKPEKEFLDWLNAEYEQQKQGEWKWVVDRDDESIYHLQCSICHGSGFDEHHNYCPNCGCKMEKGEEDD